MVVHFVVETPSPNSPSTTKTTIRRYCCFLLILILFMTFLALYDKTTHRLEVNAKNIIENDDDLLSFLWEGGRKRMAKPVLLAKLNISHRHGRHPHMGARDANGAFGYVPDPTLLHKATPPPVAVDCSALLETRDEATFFMLTKRVKVNLEEHDRKEQEATKSKGKRRAKLLCLMYSHEPRHDRVQMMREAWGHKCDGFLVASNVTDPSVDAIDLPHDGGPEEYQGMWQKVRSMWAYVYDNYYDDFDWFHIGGDDMYVIVENLRLYLESEQIRAAANPPPTNADNADTRQQQQEQLWQMPLYLGRHFALLGDKNDIYAAGGPGYTINKAALKTLVVDGFPRYYVNAYWFAEDVMIGRTFRKLGIYPFDTRDETGADRYHNNDPRFEYYYEHLNSFFGGGMRSNYSVNSKGGVNGTAVYSTSFHYVKDADYLRRMHALLYPNTHNCVLT